jgi:biofilm protein TabA
MIADRLLRWPLYFSGPVWTRAFDYLLSLPEEAPDGTFPIDGEDLFARVMTYATVDETDAVLESHRRFIDIQITLEGAERIACFPAEALQRIAPYDIGRDVTFYEPSIPPVAEVIVHPGSFVVLFPDDAHMPQLRVGPARVIRKAVVKVKVPVV